MNNPGRKPQIFNDQLILDIIYECKKELSIKGKIKYSQVYQYALENFNNEKYPFLKKKLSEDYWRKNGRQGKELIDKVNAVEEVLLKKDNDEESALVVNTEDAVNKLFTGGNKEQKQLIDKLRNNEVNAKKFYKKALKLEEELRNEREQKILWKEKAGRLQIIIFQLLEYSGSKNFPIENIINTGKTRNEPVNKILQSVFSDEPTIGYDFTQYINNNNSNQSSKVVPIKKVERTAADDFDLL